MMVVEASLIQLETNNKIYKCRNKNIFKTFYVTKMLENNPYNCEPKLALNTKYYL